MRHQKARREERARLLIEQAEALGAPPEDPLLLLSVLYSVWAANFVAFNGDAMRRLSAQFLTLATKQKATGPLAIGHRLLATSLLHTGDIAVSRAHYDQAIALYEPVEHRPIAIRFGQVDIGVMILSYRSLALWVLGYPEAALADTERALMDAREISHAGTLMYALFHVSLPISGVEITRQQTRSSMNLSLWQTRREAHFGRLLECCPKVA